MALEGVGKCEKGAEKNAPRGRVYMLLVAPQGTTSHENKGDAVFSTIFPKFFPKRILRMCIPVFRTSSYFFVLRFAIGRSGRERNLSYAFAIKSTKTLNLDSISVAEVVE
jgi:hypothetical protein